MQAFHEMDEAKNGVLLASELRTAFEKLGVEMSIQDAINIVDEVNIIQT